MDVPPAARRPRLAWIAALGLGALACGKSAAGPDAAATVDGAYPCPGTARFQDVETTTFSGCGGEGGCHTRPPLLGAGLDLTPAAAYANLVGVASTQAVGKLRVVAGQPEQSFLWHKLNDQLGPDEGVPMPKGLATWNQLPADQLQAIYCWIAGGALND